jgi:hypothetical protein
MRKDRFNSIKGQHFPTQVMRSQTKFAAKGISGKLIKKIKRRSSFGADTWKCAGRFRTKRMRRWGHLEIGVADGARTHDHWNHNPYTPVITNKNRLKSIG